MQTASKPTAADHAANLATFVRAANAGRAAQHAGVAAAVAYRLIGCTIDGSQHFVMELSDGLGECFVDLAIWTYDDGRGACVDRFEVVCAQSWTCAAPTTDEARVWVAANKGAVEDAVFAAIEERS